jgi:hypothetical protein
MIQRFALSLMTAASLAAASFATLAQSTDAASPLAAPVVAPVNKGSYLIVTRPDLRKCAYPFCGGYYVKAVNQLLTRCADGSRKTECHAVQLDTAALGWTDEQRAAFDASFSQGQALVRGTLAQGSIQSIKADVLTVSEAWQAQVLKKPAGTFFGVKSTGIVCITAPCPSFGATVLNSSAAAGNPDLDLSSSGASDEALQAASKALGSTGILAAGKLVPVSYPSYNGSVRRGTKLVASEFYVPAKP